MPSSGWDWRRQILAAREISVSGPSQWPDFLYSPVFWSRNRGFPRLFAGRGQRTVTAFAWRRVQFVRVFCALRRGVRRLGGWAGNPPAAGTATAERVGSARPLPKTDLAWPGTGAAAKQRPRRAVVPGRRDVRSPGTVGMGNIAARSTLLRPRTGALRRAAVPGRSDARPSGTVGMGNIATRSNSLRPRMGARRWRLHRRSAYSSPLASFAR